MATAGDFTLAARFDAAHFALRHVTSHGLQELARLSGSHRQNGNVQRIANLRLVNHAAGTVLDEPDQHQQACVVWAALRPDGTRRT